MTVTYHLQQPTRRLPLNGEETGRLPANRNGQPSLLLGLAPDGGYLAAVVAYCAGGLLHHLFTLAHPLRDVGGMFLWPCPRVAPPGYYPASHPRESGLSSRTGASPGCP